MKFEKRLVVFAGECVLLVNSFSQTRAGLYYGDQLLRASGSSALHYGEAQGTITDKDFIHKVSGCLKELKECSMIFEILQYIEFGDENKRQRLKVEVRQLASIAAKMILNNKARSLNKVQKGQ